MELLPENSLVGLITFGMFAHVHELGFGAVPKTYVFKGSKDVTKDQLLEQMSFFAKKPRPAVGVVAGARDGLSTESISRFLVPASECEFTLNSVMAVGFGVCVWCGFVCAHVCCSQFDIVS